MNETCFTCCLNDNCSNLKKLDKIIERYDFVGEAEVELKQAFADVCHYYRED